MAEPHSRTTAAAPEFKPYVPDSANMPEFTPRAVILGMIFGIIFGAVTVYVGLRAGLTVSASIPIAVLSISLLRALGRATILENNIVQTTGSAGESVAAGVIFTLPALIFLGFELEYSRIFLLALLGGWLGVLFMIPLRRQLIVQGARQPALPGGRGLRRRAGRGREGRVLRQPRVLGPRPRRHLHAVPERQRPRRHPRGADLQPGAGCPARRCARPSPPSTWAWATSSGPRSRATIFAGGVFSWFVMMPAIKFFGSLVPTADLPEHGADRADDVRPALELLHPLHRRGRGGRRRAHHAAEDDAHDHRRAHARA